MIGDILADHEVTRVIIPLRLIHMVDLGVERKWLAQRSLGDDEMFIDISL